MSTITNRGEFVRGTTVSTSADRLLAYHVREFVKAMDEAGIPDEAQVSDRHSFETRHLTGLHVRIEDRLGEETPE